jgi:hypothetical protein
MKKLIIGSFITVVLAVTGCATPHPAGIAYTELQLPITATDNTGRWERTGTASCRSILALVATGDCSIEAAKRNGGITEVHHVDWQVENILGVIGNYTLRVYGN